MFCAVLFMTVAMFVASAGATAGDCNCGGTPDLCHASFTMTTPGNHYKFRVNVDDAAFFGLTALELSQAAQLAAANWNDNSNGATFEYDGTTIATDASCSGAGWSLIWFSNDQASPSTAGHTDPRCASGATWGQFVTKMSRRSTSCCPSGAGGCVNCPTAQTCENQGGGVPQLCVRIYGNGAVTGGRDIAALITHELGHVQGLGHPQNGEYATMASPIASSHQRDFYEWDLICAHPTSSDRRARTGRYRTVTSTFSGEGTLTTANAVTKVSSGRTWTGSAWQWASGQHRRTLVGHDENLANSPATISGVTTSNAVGFVSGIWRETTGTDRVFYSFTEDYGTDFVVTAEHGVLQARSTNSFSTAPSANYLTRCSGMGASFLTCDANPTNIVMSARRVAVAWLASPGRTVMAWVDTDHSGDGTNSTSNVIKVTVGKVDDDTLPLAALVNP